MAGQLNPAERDAAWFRGYCMENDLKPTEDDVEAFVERVAIKVGEARLDEEIARIEAFECFMFGVKNEN